MSSPYIGEIRMVAFGSNNVPSGWALCDGQLLSIAQNQALFSLLGTSFGGNGSSNFALPDLRARVAMGVGQGIGLSNRNLGDVFGTETVELLTTQMPNHSHGLACNTGGGTQASPANGFPAVESTGTSLNYAATGGNTMNAAVVGATGGGQPVPTLPPTVCINFMIALSGIFPQS